MSGKIGYCICLYSNIRENSLKSDDFGPRALFQIASPSGSPSQPNLDVLKTGCQISRTRLCTPLTPNIPSKIRKAVFVVLRAKPLETEWINVKKPLLRMLPPELRGLFGRRHSVTKKQLLKPMDILVLELWLQVTNRLLNVVLHDETKYTYRGRGFGLKQWHQKNKS